MSVIQSKRKLAKTEFLKVAHDLKYWTIIYTRQKHKPVNNDYNLIPFCYRDSISKPLNQKVDKVLELIQVGNEIFPTNKDEFQMRRNCFLQAYGLCVNIQTNIQIAYDIINFKTSSFEQWTSINERLISLIKGVIKSDKEKFRF